MPPAPDGSHVIVSNPVGGPAVFRSGKHKDAAWKFAEFAASAPMDGYWNAEVGQIPANTDVVGQSWVAANPTLKEALRVFNDPATKVVQLPYYLPQFNSITKTDMEPLYQQVLLGKLSAKDFLDQFAGKFDAAQAQWRQRHGG